MKKIILATGIFPPDIGGPALYCQKLAEYFFSGGAEVLVFTYGKRFSGSDKYRIFGISRLWPYGLRQAVYFLKLAARAGKSDAILAFDSLGAGLPAVLSGKLFGNKVVIRMGGDFIWEKSAESGACRATMAEFYRRELHTDYPVLFRLIKFVLKNSDSIIFTTEFQRDIFTRYYGLDAGRIAVIGNVFEKEPGKIQAIPIDPKTILWAGRFIKLKNLEFLLRVFKRLADHDDNLVLKLIGDGPEFERLKVKSRKSKVEDNVRFVGSLSEDSLAEEIKKSYFCVLPSLNEISPNFALKCLSLNKPIVITQETGIKKEFPGLMYADPKNEESFYQAMLRLLDENSYDNYQKFIYDIHYRKTWQDLAEEYLEQLEVRSKN